MDETKITSLTTSVAKALATIYLGDVGRDLRRFKALQGRVLNEEQMRRAIAALEALEGVRGVVAKLLDAESRDRKLQDNWEQN